MVRFFSLKYYRNLLNREYLKEKLVVTYIKLFPYRYANSFYKNITKRSINYKKPKSIEDKLFWLARYWKNPLIIKCTDKFLVRDYVSSFGFGDILIPLIGVYDDANNIDFNLLPNKYVLKCNHGCGFNIICKDKSKLNELLVKNQLNYWIQRPYGIKNAEYHYQKILPKIICEEFLEDKSNKTIIDYKIHCFYGNPHSILVISERGEDMHDNIKSSYSLDWKKLNKYYRRRESKL